MLFKLLRNLNFNDYFYKSFCAVFLLNLSRIGLQFFLGIVLVRILGVSDYGLYAYIIVLINMLALLSSMGLPKLSIREVSIYSKQKRWTDLKYYLIQSHKVNFLMTMMVLLTLLLLFKFFVQKFYGSHLINSFILGFFLFPFLSFGLLRMGILCGLKHPVLGQMPDYLITPAVFITLVGVGFIFFRSLHIETVLLLQLVAAIVGFVVGSIFLYKKIPTNIFSTIKTIEQRHSMLVKALPFLCLAGMAIINDRVDILLLGLLRKTSDVGVYQIVVLFSQTLGLPLVIYNLIVNPTLAHLYCSNNIDELQQMVSIGAKVTFLLTFLGVLFLAIFGYWILTRAYGPFFGEMGYLPLIVLGAAQLINVGFGSVGAILNMTGYEKIVMYTTTVAIVLNIFLNFIFIPMLGIVGSAISSGCVLVFWNAVLCFFVRKKVNINPCVTYNAKNLIKALLYQENI